MTLQRPDWEDVSQAVRDLVQARTGPVLAARTASAGHMLAEDEALKTRAVDRALASCGREESTGRTAAL